MTQALRAYMDLGDAESVKRIRSQLPGANERAMDGMQEVTAQVTITNQQIESMVMSMAAAEEFVSVYETDVRRLLI